MDETTLDLRDIIKILKKRRRMILGIFFAFTLAAAVISLIIPPTYESSTTLRIKQPKGLGSSLLSDLPVGGGNTKTLMSTYAEILKSRTVVQAVIDKTQAEKEKILRYEDFITTITTQPVKDTEILNIKTQAKSSEEAQLIANTLVAEFLQRMTNLVREEQKVVREFIGQRLEQSKSDLAAAEAKLEKYKRDQQILAPDVETKAFADRMSDINKLEAQNTVALASAQAKLQGINSQLGQHSNSAIADSPLIQQYKAKLADLEVQLVSLQQQYTDKNPKVQTTQAAIAETKAKLNSEISRVINASSASNNPIHLAIIQNKIQAEVEVASASAQKTAITKIIADSEKDLAKLPAKEQGFVRVLRDATVAQEIFVMLAKRHEEARISEVMQPTEVQVIDAAVLPDKPIKPRKVLNTAIGAILGLFLGTGLAFALEFMNRTIRTAEDVRTYLDIPVLGSIPDFNSEAPKQSSGLFAQIKQWFETKPKKRQHHRA